MTHKQAPTSSRHHWIHYAGSQMRFRPSGPRAAVYGKISIISPRNALLGHGQLSLVIERSARIASFPPAITSESATASAEPASPLVGAQRSDTTPSTRSFPKFHPKRRSKFASSLSGIRTLIVEIQIRKFVERYSDADCARE